MPSGSIVKLASELASPATAAAFAALIARCATCSSPGEVAAVLGTAAATTGPYISVLGLSELHTWIRSKSSNEQLQEQFRTLHAQLARIEEARASEQELIGLVGELLGERIRRAEEIQPEQILADIKASIEAGGEAITKEMDAWFKDTSIYLSKIATDAQRAAEASESGLEVSQEVLSEVQLLRKSIAQITEHFMAQLHEANAENDSLREKVQAAIERVAEVEREAGRDPIAKLESLRQGDPKDLLTFLDVELDRDEQEFIEKHRERAAVAYVLGEITKAKQSLDKIIALLPTDLDAINNLGHIYKLLGDLPGAETQYKLLLELDTSEAVAAVALGNLGLIEGTRGNPDAAEGYHKRALAINESLGRMVGMANQLGNLGLIEQTRGNLEAADGYHKRSLAIEKSIGRKEGMASDLGNLGLIELTRGNLAEAEDYLKRGLAIDESLGHKEGMAATLGNLGGIELVRGNLEVAEVYLIRSLSICESLGGKEVLANQLANLGRLERARGHAATARDYWNRALGLYKEIGMPHMVERLQSWLDELPDNPV